jgi:hypothetical protein
MPALPADDIDLLIVDWMGKDISGAGMDPNIIGRIYVRGEREPERPRIKAIYVRDLTAASHGNALGTGLADVISRRIHDKIDFRAVVENAYTSSFLERAKVPIVADTDEAGIAIALRSCGALEPGQERIMRIRSTLHLEQLYLSASLLEELRGRTDIKTGDETVPLVDSSASCPEVW